MKLLIFNFEYPPLGGGGGVATRDIAETLADRHDITVITTHWQELPKFARENRVKVYRIPVMGRSALATASVISLLTFAIAALWYGYKIIQKEKFDIINAQFAVPSGLPAAILARWFGLPLVVSLVGGDLYDPTKGLSPHRHWWLRATVRWVAESAVICTAISSDTRRRAIDLYGITKEIVVTHLGIRPVPDGEAGGNNAEKSDVFTMVTIGRLIPRKGYEVLLRAVKHLAQGKLIIMGGGPLEVKLRELIVRMDLTERVELMGQVSEAQKKSLLARADIYVSASEHEGFGIVFLEAMDYGLPIVATDNGGQMDFLSEENAIIVGAGDDDGLARGMKSLMLDAGKRSAMAANNRRQVKNFYLEETTRQFEEVLSRANKSRR